MKKKELWIVNHYATPPGYGGLTRHYYLAKYIQKLGYDVKIFASSAIHNSSFNFIDEKDKSLYKETVIDGVTYVHVKTNQYQGNGFGRIKNILLFYLRSKKVLKIYSKKSIPDAIYTSSPTPFSAPVTNKFAKKHNIQSLIEVRDLWPYSMYAYGILKSKKNPIYVALAMVEKKMYLGADKILFTMNNGKDYLKEQKYSNKIDFNKVKVLHNGIDIEEYKTNLKKYVVKDKDLDSKKFKVVYAGSIRHIYDVEMIAKVAESLKDYKDIEFLIYGKGNETEIVENYIKNHKLKNIKLKGFVDVKKLPSILERCQLALVHGKSTDISKYGMSTNKSYLYLCAGLPIISTYQTLEDEYLTHNCGKSIKIYSVEEYRNTILEFYSLSKKDLKEKANNAKAYSKAFDYKNIAKELKVILEEL